MYCLLLVCLMPLLTFAEKPCHVAHDEYQRAMANSALPLLGAEEPRCDGNGQYQDRICSGSVCMCVMPNGDEISEFRHHRFEINEANMDCKCARKAAIYRATGLIGLYYSCTVEGAFEPIQCTGSMCYCADNNGVKVGRAVHITKSYTLNCS